MMIHPTRPNWVAVISIVTGVPKVSPDAVANWACTSVTPFAEACGVMARVWDCPGCRVTNSESGMLMRCGVSEWKRSCAVTGAAVSLVIVMGRVPVDQLNTNCWADRTVILRGSTEASGEDSIQAMASSSVVK